MKCLLLFLSLFPCASFAATYYPLEQMPKAECVSALETVLNPGSAVENGLNALDSVNENKKSLDSCFADMFTNWEGKFQLKQSADLISTTKYQKSINDINKQFQCFNPYSDYGKDYVEQYKKQMEGICDDKWLSKEEASALAKKKQEIEQTYYLFSSVPNTYREVMEAENLQLKKENYKLNYCKPNPYPEGNYNYNSFENNFKTYCGGKIFSSDELVEQQQLVNKMQQEINKKMSDSQVLVSKLSQLLSYGPPSDVIFDQLDTLVPLAKELICTSPYTESGPYYQNWKYNTSNYCNGKFGTPAELPAVRAKFLDALGNLDELKTKIETERKLAQQKAMALQEAAMKLKYLSYSYHRLYSMFARHLKQGGGTDNLGDFCEKYEADMAKEKKFFETQLTPNGNRVSFRSFDGNWMPLEKYGLTEAEHSILAEYIGSFYGALNKSLYNGNITPEAQLYRETLNAALDKIPPYQGGPLLRFSTLPEKFLEQHQVGEVITYESFTSTSKKETWNWQGGGNSRFLIYNGGSGKDVAKDFNEGEQEVIFKAGTRFKVLSKEKTPNSTYFILVEVDDKGAPLASVVPPKDWIP